MSLKYRRVVILIALLLAAAGSASAQQTTAAPKLEDLLPDLILRGITLPRPTTANELSHEAHFSPVDANELNNPAVAVVGNFNKLMIGQLSTFPVGSSAGGFTYTFDESLGTFRRASSSFGPSFAERAITIGRRRLSAGITYQHTPYQRFEGQNLDDGSIKFYLRHQECCSPGSGSSGGGGGGGGAGGGGGQGPTTNPNGTRLSPAFEGDLIEAALSLKATTDTVAMFGNYGLTDRWDVALVVPIVHVDLDATVNATIQRLATATSPLTHTFEAGNPNATQKSFHESGSATGLGDILLRTKYRLLTLPGGGIAAAVDVRLPSGDVDSLLGAGAQTKVLFIASGGGQWFAPHVNFGYSFSKGEVGSNGFLAQFGGSESLPDEINYAIGSEVIVNPKLTVNADVVGRTLRNSGRLDVMTKTFEYQGLTAVQTAQFSEFEARSGNMNLALGALGFKFNPVGDILVSGNVLFPLTQAGLRSRLTTVIGLDYAF
jgi:Putative MetA-pathway of phenol degradation